MLPLIMLVLTTVARAAAISKPLPQPRSNESLVERMSFIHNWAIVCMYDRDVTNYCQKYYGYGCDAQGKTRTVLYEENCDVLCSCIDLSPKPACMVGLTGQSWCLRDVNQNSGVQGQDQEASIMENASPTLPFATTTDDTFPDSPLDSGLASTSLTMSDRFSHIVQTPDSEQHSAAANKPPSDDLSLHTSHRWAMLCAGNDTVTTECSRTGYNCDTTGSVRAFKPSDHHCIDMCTCLDRLSMTSCSVDENGLIKCDESSIQEDAIVRHIIEVLSADYSLASRNDGAAGIPHNYAMVCASDKEETIFCQKDGYYCNGNGKIVIPALPSKYCTDYCVCINVGTKMYCMMANSGAMYCLRSEMDSEAQFFDQTQDTSFDMASSELAGEVTKRSEQYESTDYADLKHRGHSTPLHNDNADWGFHNMAMVCMNDRFWTNFCQGYGYYCTSSGNLVQKADLWGNVGCQANCLCIDLLPKPNCIMNLIGGVVCARDIEETEYDSQKVINKAELRNEPTHTKGGEDFRSPENDASDDFVTAVSSESTLITCVKAVSFKPNPPRVLHTTLATLRRTRQSLKED